MNDSENSGNGGKTIGDAKSQTLMAVAELERRRHEASRRVKLLGDERRALVEIGRCIAEEEQVLAQQLALMRKDNDQLAVKVERAVGQSSEVDEEIEHIRREIALLQCRCAEQESRGKELEREIDRAAVALRASKDNIASATTELEVGRATLSRMDYKLAGRTK
jgi:chromosome segregation ATPase